MPAAPPQRNAPTVDAGRRALTTPATATSSASAAYGPVSVTMRTLAIRYSALRGGRVARGHDKATVAVAHSILVSAIHILDRGVPYDDLGADWFQRGHSPGAAALEPRTIGRAVGQHGVDEINTSGRRCTLRVRRLSLPAQGDHAAASRGTLLPEPRARAAAESSRSRRTTAGCAGLASERLCANASGCRVEPVQQERDRCDLGKRLG